jgi:hypothetical protein
LFFVIIMIIGTSLAPSVLTASDHVDQVVQ